MLARLSTPPRLVASGEQPQLPQHRQGPLVAAGQLDGQHRGAARHHGRGQRVLRVVGPARMHHPRHVGALGQLRGQRRRRGGLPGQPHLEGLQAAPEQVRRGRVEACRRRSPAAAAPPEWCPRRTAPRRRSRRSGRRGTWWPTRPRRRRPARPAAPRTGWRRCCRPPAERPPRGPARRPPRCPAAAASGWPASRRRPAATGPAASAVRHASRSWPSTRSTVMPKPRQVAAQQVAGVAVDRAGGDDPITGPAAG